MERATSQWLSVTHTLREADTHHYAYCYNDLMSNKSLDAASIWELKERLQDRKHTFNPAKEIQRGWIREISCYCLEIGHRSKLIAIKANRDSKIYTTSIRKEKINSGVNMLTYDKQLTNTLHIR